MTQLVKADWLEVSIDIDDERNGLAATGWETFATQDGKIAVIVVDMNQSNCWDDEKLDAASARVMAAFAGSDA